MVRVVIVGATGRMGRTLVGCARQMQGVVVTGAVDRPDNPSIGRDVGELAGIGSIGVPVVGELAAALLAGADVVVDFSDPASTAGNLEACARSRAAVLVGTTGLPAEIEAHAARAATAVPVMVASNTSLGVTLLTALVRECARLLPADFDIEIIEAHHRHKKDAPSGTALALGRAAAEGRGAAFDDVAVMGRAGIAPRRSGEISFAVVRGGDIVGEHDVIFAGTAEKVTLSHQATDRAVFARGALQAACWLAGRPAGRYGMSDFISLKTKA
jgi:4-hydroxy-tetrahydrodipicolinate reductase